MRHDITPERANRGFDESLAVGNQIALFTPGTQALEVSTSQSTTVAVGKSNSDSPSSNAQKTRDRTRRGELLALDSLPFGEARSIILGTNDRRVQPARLSKLGLTSAQWSLFFWLDALKLSSRGWVKWDKPTHWDCYEKLQDKVSGVQTPVDSPARARPPRYVMAHDNSIRWFEAIARGQAVLIDPQAALTLRELFDKHPWLLASYRCFRDLVLHQPDLVEHLPTRPMPSSSEEQEADPVLSQTVGSVRLEALLSAPNQSRSSDLPQLNRGAAASIQDDQVEFPDQNVPGYSAIKNRRQRVLESYEQQLERQNANEPIVDQALMKRLLEVDRPEDVRAALTLSWSQMTQDQRRLCQMLCRAWERDLLRRSRCAPRFRTCVEQLQHNMAQITKEVGAHASPVTTDQAVIQVALQSLKQAKFLKQAIKVSSAVLSVKDVDGNCVNKIAAVVPIVQVNPACVTTPVLIPFFSPTPLLMAVPDKDDPERIQACAQQALTWAAQFGVRYCGVKQKIPMVSASSEEATPEPAPAPAPAPESAPTEPPVLPGVVKPGCDLLGDRIEDPNAPESREWEASDLEPRIAEMYTFYAGMQQLAEQVNAKAQGQARDTAQAQAPINRVANYLHAQMVTVTLPSGYHPNPKQGNIKNWQGYLTKESAKELNRRWAKLLEHLNKQGYPISGLKVMEFHEDGCVHLHAMVLVSTHGYAAWIRELFKLNNGVKLRLPVLTPVDDKAREWIDEDPNRLTRLKAASSWASPEPAYLGAQGWTHQQAWLRANRESWKLDQENLEFKTAEDFLSCQPVDKTRDREYRGGVELAPVDELLGGSVINYLLKYLKKTLNGGSPDLTKMSVADIEARVNAVLDGSADYLDSLAYRNHCLSKVFRIRSYALFGIRDCVGLWRELRRLQPEDMAPQIEELESDPHGKHLLGLWCASTGYVFGKDRSGEYRFSKPEERVQASQFLTLMGGLDAANGTGPRKRKRREPTTAIAYRIRKGVLKDDPGATHAPLGIERVEVRKDKAGKIESKTVVAFLQTRTRRDQLLTIPLLNEHKANAALPALQATLEQVLKASGQLKGAIGTQTHEPIRTEDSPPCPAANEACLPARGLGDHPVLVGELVGELRSCQDTGSDRTDEVNVGQQSAAGVLVGVDDAHLLAKLSTHDLDGSE